MLSHFSHVQLFVTLWTVARQAPLSMGFSRQEYWSGLPCLPPGDLPNPGIETVSPAAPVLQADSLPGKPINNNSIISITKSLFNIISNHEEDEAPGKYKDQQVIVCRDHKNSVPKREMSKTSVLFPQ